MTSFQLFKGLTAVDSELLVGVEAVELSAGKPVKRMPAKKIWLIAAAIALALLLVGCAVAYVNGWFQTVFTARSETPLSPEQIAYIQKNEQPVEQGQTMDDWTIDLKSTISDGKTGYLVFRVTAPEDIDLEQYLNSPTVDGKRLSMGNYSASRKAGYSYAVVSIGTVDAERNYWYQDKGEWISDGDGKANTVLFCVTLSCEKIDPSKPMLLEDPFGKDISFKIRLMGVTLEYTNQALEKELDEKYAGQDYLVDGDELAGLFCSDILTDEEWDFQVTFAPDSQFIELISQPVSVQTRAWRYADETQWDTVDTVEEMEILSFQITPFGARITYDSRPDVAAISPKLSDGGDTEIYAVMKDGSRIRLNADGADSTVLTAETPIVLEQFDHILLEDGTELFSPVD